MGEEGGGLVARGPRYFRARNYLADYSRGCNVIQLVQESPVVWVRNWR